MIVTCESCQARFRLDDGKVGPEGARVRCSKCSHTFVVMPSADAPMTIDSDEVSSLDDEDDTKVMGSAPSPLETGIIVELDADPTAPDPGDAPTRNVRADAMAALGKSDSESIHQMETKVHSVQGLREQAASLAEATGAAPFVSATDPMASVADPFAAAADPFASAPSVGPKVKAGLEHELFSDVVGDESGATAVSLGGDGGFGSPQPMGSESTVPAPVDDGDERPLSMGGAVVVYLALAAAGLLVLAGVSWLVAPNAAQELLHGQRLVLPSEGDVQVASARAVLYPTRIGKALVITGEVTNQGSASLSNGYVVVELRTAQGALQAEGQGPIGAEVAPPHLRQLEGAESLRRLWQQIAAGSRALPAGGTQPFSVVFLPAPSAPAEVAYHLRVTSGSAIAPLPAAEPAVAEAVSGAEAEAVDVEGEDEDEKGKKPKGKVKAKKGKVKKAKAKKGKRK